ncbi:hypothetical protein BGX27_009905 [Mortierella sp. AM989]|nr:hypothetical protein BGX27_009905 [Mortierella sp. AM989]
MVPLSPGPANGSGSGANSSSGPGANPDPSTNDNKPTIASDPERGAKFTSEPNTNTGPAATNKKPVAFRNLQPRAAAAMDFNDNMDSDEEYGGLLSEDYKAQRKTTRDLVDFLNSGPPELPPGANLRQQQQKSTATNGDEDKKKRSFLQKLRPRKSNSNIANSSNTNGQGNSNRRSSVLMNGTGSSVSSVSGVTVGKGRNGEDVTTATLPNGKKYVMIVIDYKEPETGAINGSGGVGSSGASTLRVEAAVSRRQSRVPDEIDSSLLLGATSKRTSMMSNLHDDAYSAGVGDARRRSAVGTGEASKFVLDNRSFLLDSLSLDANSYLTQEAGVGGASGGLQRAMSTESRGESSSTSDMSRSGSKRASKVTFSTPRATSAAFDETAVSEELAQRIASHKAKQQQKSGSSDPKARSLAGSSSASLSTSTQDFPEIILPKPVSRKKVRHVQIQTQHSIMRPMYTQTEPCQYLEAKDWSTQTSGTTDVGTSTIDTNDATSSMTATDMSVISPTSPLPLSKKDALSGTMSSGRRNSKVASLVASLTQPTAATTTTTTAFATSRSAATSPTSPIASNSFPTPITTQNGTSTTTTTMSTATAVSTTIISPQDELAQLRQQNAQLQSQVTSLERDLSAEMRARARTAVAMQDTRVKFEMLSGMAFEKLKELLFHRQVLDKEMQELRAQVDLQSEAGVIQQGEMLFRQEQLQIQMLQQQQQFHQVPSA